MVVVIDDLDRPQAGPAQGAARRLRRRISRVIWEELGREQMNKPVAGAGEGPAAMSDSRLVPAASAAWPRIAGMALLLTAAPLSRAAGLGELQRQSALGEPLDIVISLSNDGRGDPEGITARVATQETYEALGLKRDRALEDAGIRVEKGKGALRLHVTGSRLVMEPILSLVVEINYGAGVIRRDYDLLMDPPTSDSYQRYASAAPADEPAEAVEPAPEPNPERQPEPRPLVAARRPPAAQPEPYDGSAVRHVAHRSRPAPELALGEDYIPVVWGTTLGDIAAALRARPGIPLAKLEQALYQANPQAFSGGPSRLRAGSQLRVPVSDLFKSSAERMAAAAPPAVVMAPPAAAMAMGATPPPTAVAMSDAVAAAAVPPLPAAFPAPPAAALIQHLKLSEQELSAFPPPRALARTTQQAVSPAPVAAVAVGAVAAQADRGTHPRWSIPWGTVFSLPLWSGVALLWLGFAWVRVRRSLATRVKPAQARQPALAGPSVYRALSLSLPTLELDSSRVDKKRKLHATERNDFSAFAEFRPPEATHAPAGSHAHSAASVIEVDDTGHYAEAEDFLIAALALHPERADLRLKLLEIYSAAGNLQGFTEQARQYVASNKGDRSVHWNEVRRMGLDLDPEWSLLKATGQDLSAPTAASAPPPRARRFYDSLEQAGLEAALEQVEVAYTKVCHDPAFIAAIVEMCASEIGLPTPYWHAEALSKRVGGAQIYIKREDLRPLNTDLMINALGQVMLAKWAGRSSVIAGLEDGRHGEAVAKAAKALNVPAIICVPQALLDDADHPVIRSLDHLNAILMPTGAEDGVAVPDGRRSAMKRWLEAPGEILYISSLRSSPMPYPVIVRDFQALLGQEIRRQAFRHGGGLPRAIVSSIEGGYATFGLIQSFLETGDVRIECVEIEHPSDQAVPVTAPGYARELSWLRANGRVEFSTVSKKDVSATAEMCSEARETIPTPNNACALTRAVAIARELPATASVVALFA
jgi:tryptophan synthase beta subunit/Tfp pilus assembly protein FimV